MFEKDKKNKERIKFLSIHIDYKYAGRNIYIYIYLVEDQQEKDLYKKIKLIQQIEYIL